MSMTELSAVHGRMASAARSLLGRLEPRLLSAGDDGRRALDILPTFTYKPPRASPAACNEPVGESKGEVAETTEHAAAAGAGAAAGGHTHAATRSGDHDHDAANHAPAQCSVCLLAFEEGDTLRILPCLHLFHQECVDQWLCAGGGITDGGRPCPLCKHPVSAADLQRTRFKQAAEEASRSWRARGSTFVDLYGDDH